MFLFRDSFRENVQLFSVAKTDRKFQSFAPNDGAQLGTIYKYLGAQLGLE